MNWLKDNWFYVFISIALLYMMNEKYNWFDINKNTIKKFGLEYSSPKKPSLQRVQLMNKTVRVKDTEWQSTCFHTHTVEYTNLLIEVNSINGTPVDIFLSKREDFNIVLHKRPGYFNKALYSQREIISISETERLAPNQRLCFGIHHADGPVNKVQSLFVSEKPAAAIQVKLEVY